MKALRLYGPDDLRLDEVEKPTAPRGGMVLKVDACAICGSDLRNVKAGGSAHKMKMPAILGHEFSGTIVELGKALRITKSARRSSAPRSSPAATAAIA